MDRWEYAMIFTQYDPGSSEPGQVLLNLPGSGTTELKGLVIEHLNALGADGWEMFAAPHPQNAVFTYQAANGTWHDRAYTVEMTYHLKRRLP